MQLTKKSRLIVFFVFSASVAWAGAAQQRPVTFADIMNMRAVGDAVISPDGAWVLYTVRQWEASSDESGRMDSRTHIWRVSTDGGEAQQMTSGERDESSPAWSPDGNLMSFLSARDGGEGGDDPPKAQIWVMRTDGGEAWKLTEVAEGVTSYRWAPDSRRIAFTAREALSEEEEKKRKCRDDAEVYEGDFRMHHLWTVEVETGEAVQRTAGADMTLRGTPSWSPNGERIAFTAAPTPMIRDYRSDIYILSLDGGAVEKITTNLGADDSPEWSPDGQKIAFISTPTDARPIRDGTLLSPVVNSHLMLYEVTTGSVRDLAERDFDLSPGSPTWAPDGGRIVVTVGSRVYREMFAYDLDSRRYVQLTVRKMISFGNLSRDGSRAALVMESDSEPPEVYVSDGDFQDLRKLTTVNPQVRNFALGETEVVGWKSSDGLEIEGLLLKPVDFEEGRRYPLLVVAHGGPTGAHTASFRVRYGDGGQHWAGQGWAVLYPNPRGSSNYGEEFMRGNIPDWGGGDYQDIMSGVDALIERGIADPEKLAVQGWSYGGYLTCWIVSQTTRFKAAMMGAGLSNLVSMYGTNDIPNYLGTFFDGIVTPENYHLYVERSGLTTAGDVTTPLLILHGGNDQRVPIGQPMEFFRALKDRGKTVELVFYPREGHGLREYYHQLDRLQRQYEWITRHTLGTSETN